MVLPSRPSEFLEPGDNIALQYPSFHVDASTACQELLTLSDPADENVLWVSFSKSPNECCENWTTHVETSPGRAAIVNVAAETRSTAVSPNEENHELQTAMIDPAIDEVAPPSDLTTLSVRITDWLDTWAAAETDRQSVICFDSISLLHQYQEFQQTYEFLQTLTDHVSAIGAIAHYHLNSAAHELETLQRFSDVFDMNYVYKDGKWTLRIQ